MREFWDAGDGMGLRHLVALENNHLPIDVMDHDGNTPLKLGFILYQCNIISKSAIYFVFLDSQFAQNRPKIDQN